MFILFLNTVSEFAWEFHKAGNQIKVTRLGKIEIYFMSEFAVWGNITGILSDDVMMYNH